MPKQKRNQILVSGIDANPAVGRQSLEDADIAVNAYAYGDRKSQGEWLARWCLIEDCVLTNTMFDTAMENWWTYQNGGSYRQIDYIAVGRKTGSLVSHVVAYNIITFGNEHRTIKAIMQVETSPGRRRRRNKVRPNGKGWKAEDAKKYEKEVDDSMEKLMESGQDWLLNSLDGRCKAIEVELVAVAKRNRKQDRAQEARHIEPSKKAYDLMNERRAIRRQNARRSSKDIQKEVWKHMRKKKWEQIEVILEDCKGRTHIADIWDNCKKILITSLQDNNGELHQSRDSIANAFADFYTALYDSGDDAAQADLLGSEREGILPIECEEANVQLQHMKNNKAQDGAGVVAEMLQSGGQKLLGIITDVFNDILLREQAPAEAWKETRLRVLSKKGDKSNLENYRPVAILPILLKLFSRVLYGRVK